MNGNEIKEECASQLSALLIEIRTILAQNNNLPTAARLWLLLALDIANNRFGLLPTELHQFYVSKLGDDAISQIKKLDTELSIQISYQNMKLDGHQSNVTVLQKVPNKPKETNWEPTKNITENEKSLDTHQNFNTSHNFNTPKSNFNNMGTWEQPKHEKTPRPILGVGARLKHEENKTDERNDSLSSGWDNKKKEESSWGSKHRKNVSKGWEHDDRLEKEYN